MHVDLRTSKPTELSAEFVVVGSGTAGQTIARALVEAGRKTLLLESGGLDYENDTADLNDGRNVGQPYYDLKSARLRLFGGTAAIWGGRSAELNPIDFETRPWVSWSGWPFGIETLRPYYDRTWQSLGIPPSDESLVPPKALEAYRGSDIIPLAWRIDREPDRFGAARNRDLFNHRSMTVVTHATVCEIRPKPDGQEIEYLDVRSPTGGSIKARGRYYIIAAGGIENARLLLASNSLQPGGIGNGGDLVGRFFMEHPHGRGGRLTGKSAWPLVRAFQKRSSGEFDVAWLLAASAELQERKEILNSALTVAVRPPPHGRLSPFGQAYRFAKHKLSPNNKGRRLWQLYKQASRAVRGNVIPFGQWVRHQRGQAELAVVLRAEQSPNPDSRVRLSGEKDANGLPRVELDWRLQRQDRESAAILVETLGREQQRLGFGSVELAEWLAEPKEDWISDPLVSTHPLGGYHHMGTTRMATDPSRGVTDGWGRVHGIGNLYLAGSSLFPTSGWANPTLTIMALSLRTADHLLALPAA